MPDVRIHLPESLKPFAEGASFLDVRADTVDEALDVLEKSHALIHGRLFDDDGRIRGYVNVFLDGREVRTLNGDARRTVDGSHITIVPSIAGG